MGIEIIDTEQAEERTEGLYLVQRWGWITWPDRYNADAYHRERGGRLRLIDGRTPLAYGEWWSANPVEWTKTCAAAAAEIEPWVRTLRILQPIDALQAQTDYLTQDGHFAALDQNPDAQERILQSAGPEEIERATHSASEIDYVQLAAIVADRLRWNVARSQMVAMAAAPTPLVELPSAWEVPRERSGLRSSEPGGELRRYLARHLLQGWAFGRDQRDAVVSWARGAGLSETAIATQSGLARTTLNRIN